MQDNDPGVAQLRRWQDAGGRWRVLTRTPDAVMVALLTCGTGEEVDRLSATGPALLTFLGDRDSSEDEGGAGPAHTHPLNPVARDRDIAGRPRNAPPRDALGRPLKRGAPGIPTTPDDLDVPPPEALQRAQKLLDDGLPFHASGSRMNPNPRPGAADVDHLAGTGTVVADSPYAA